MSQLAVNGNSLSLVFTSWKQIDERVDHMTPIESHFICS